VASLDELYRRVAERAAATAEGGWVIGSGYDQNKTGGHPERDVLDRIAPGRRVWLHHDSRHMCVVSSPVLADLGIDATAPRVPGGRVAADASGRPNGLMEERAQEMVDSLARPFPLEALAQAIGRAGARYLAEGITSGTEAGIGGGWIGHSPIELAAYQLARDTGRLHVRTELMIASDVLRPVTAHPDDGVELGIDLGIRARCLRARRGPVPAPGRDPAPDRAFRRGPPRPGRAGGQPGRDRRPAGGGSPPSSATA
jgi:predicted amidohydrolase YtcJ